MHLSYSNTIIYNPDLIESVEKGAEIVNHVVGLDKNVAELIEKFVSKNGRTTVLRAKTQLNIEVIEDGFHNIVNLQRINDIRWVNKFFEEVNKKLPCNGIYVGCVETHKQRKRRIYKRYPKHIALAFWILSSIYNRVIPKLQFTKKVYFKITKGSNRILSKAETFGRLVSCGFEILGFVEVNNLLYFACRKIKDPLYDTHPSYGLFFKMKRVGKDGKIINVHKVRTMYPFAEYLQEYIYTYNNLDSGGKFKNDFRITYWGRFIRRWFIDELPMLINWFKGDLKLVGLRPLSEQYLSLYSKEFRDRRLKYKPGLIPPYYVDLPKTLEGIVRSEEKYLNSYEKNPVITDIKYFFKVFYNIIFRNVRSK